MRLRNQASDDRSRSVTVPGHQRYVLLTVAVIRTGTKLAGINPSTVRLTLKQNHGELTVLALGSLASFKAGLLISLLLSILLKSLFIF